MSYDNNMTGVLFVNNEKLTDKHPDRKGSLEIDGVKYWISAWDKQTSRGETISIKIEPAKKAVEAMPKTPVDYDDFETADIPF